MNTDTEQQETSEQLGYIRRGFLGRFFGSLMHVLGFAVVGPLVGILAIVVIAAFAECGISAPCLARSFGNFIAPESIPFLLIGGLIAGLPPAIVTGVLYVLALHLMSPSESLPLSRRPTIGAFIGLFTSFLWINIFFLIVDKEISHWKDLVIHPVCGAIAGAICAALMGERFYRWCFYRRALK